MKPAEQTSAGFLLSFASRTANETYGQAPDRQQEGQHCGDDEPGGKEEKRYQQGWVILDGDDDFPVDRFKQVQCGQNAEGEHAEEGGEQQAREAVEIGAASGDNAEQGQSHAFQQNGDGDGQARQQDGNGSARNAGEQYK